MQKLDLNGVWKVRWSNGKFGHAESDHVDIAGFIDAIVPGEVHLDLMRSGIIADPNTGLGSLACRWVEESFWSYRREFDAPEDALASRAWLCFGGLDLVATIKLNGETIGSHENSFTPYRIDVTGKLRASRNILIVHIEGGLFSVSDKPGEGFNNDLDQKLHKRHWLRKPQCQFGWDWSPRLINVGITGDVMLEWSKPPARIDSLVPLASLDETLTRGSVRSRLFVEGLTDQPVSGRMSVEIAELGIASSVDVTIEPGLKPIEMTIDVPNPELWWPVGQGNARLYDINVSLAVDGQAIGACTARIGFRHIRINQDKHPSGGRLFIIEVNGRPVFAKGANFVPADLIYPNLDRQRYDTLTDLALEANFNMLRVWGGGLYESNDLYELCDEKGILVWQEFIYACGRYPMQDASFFNNAKEEAVYQVRRLASHPSLIVWCGNNEMEWGSWDWGYDRAGQIMPDYAFFHLTLPRILAQEDPSRYYQPSSPFSPDGQSPNADSIGDQHPWTVGVSGFDWHVYRSMTCRFPNEGGVLGATSLPTTLACLPEGQRKIGSFAWCHHDNTFAESGLPGFNWDGVNHFVGKDVNAMAIEEFVYWAGLLQGEALREYIDNFRRRKFDSASAIFWMYNDCWPTTRSWSIVDYYLRRMPSFCPVKRAFAPVSVVVAEEGDDIVVYGVNDSQVPIAASLRYGLMRLDGAYPLDKVTGVNLPANSSTTLGRFATREWLALDPDRTASIAFASLNEPGIDNSLIARNRLFARTFREMTWRRPKIEVSIQAGRAVFESDTFAWGVCLDLDGETSLADNFFDIYPHVPYTIDWTSIEAPLILRIGNLTDLAQ